MKTIDIICIISIFIIIIISLIVILYKNYNEKLKQISRKIKTSNLDFNDKLKNKYELIIRFINSIKEKYNIESKIFDDVCKIKVEDLPNLKNDKLLNKCYKELIQIKEDNQKTREIKAFKEIITSYEENELHVISLRTYYNKCILEYNNLIKKFPYNIISKVKKYDLKNILEGKEIEDNFNNNLEV